MYKLRLIIVLFFIFSACSQKEAGKKLDKDSKEYMFAKEISGNIPELDPDKNLVLVETNQFDITTGNVYDALFKNFATEIKKLKSLDSTRLKKIFNENAYLLAEKQMVIDAAMDYGYEVSQTELDSIMEIQYKKAGGKLNFEEYMKNRNVPVDYIVQDYKNSYLIQKFLKSAVKDSITISDEEIRAKMIQIKSVSVRHILLKTDGLNENDKKAKKTSLENILKRARQGESFSKLAKAYSEDSGTSKNGGLIKNIKQGDMLQPFDKIAFSLAIGEISDIFETKLGYHILTVIDRKKEDRTFESIKKDIFEQKQKLIMPKLISSLKQEYEFSQHKI